jgi:hypothetical protein
MCSGVGWWALGLSGLTDVRARSVGSLMIAALSSLQAIPQSPL